MLKYFGTIAPVSLVLFCIIAVLVSGTPFIGPVRVFAPAVGAVVVGMGGWAIITLMRHSRSRFPSVFLIGMFWQKVALGLILVASFVRQARAVYGWLIAMPDAVIWILLVDAVGSLIMINLLLWAGRVREKDKQEPRWLEEESDPVPFRALVRWAVRKLR